MAASSTPILSHMYRQIDSTLLPPDIDPERAVDVFKNLYESLKTLLQTDLENIATKLCNKSIIPDSAREEAVHVLPVPSVRTISLLSVLEGEIKVKPQNFVEFVKVLESERTLSYLAQKLVTRYLGLPDPLQYVLLDDSIRAVPGESPSLKFTVTSDSPLPEDTKHSVLDKSGKVVERFEVTSNLITFHNVEVSDSGVYTIRCHDSRGIQGRATFELMVTHPSSTAAISQRSNPKNPEAIPGVDVVPEHTSATTPLAISRYAVHLEGYYRRICVDKFPHNPSKKYINLAMVEHDSENSELEKARQNMLSGRIDDSFKGHIELSDILKALKSQDTGNIVCVEGPPGIGKSTLAMEVCRRCEKQYDLVVLLKLREVQRIKSTADLFPHKDHKLRKSVNGEVLSREGKGILFILDGYNELPLELRRQGVLVELLQGKFFSNSSILVTTRPSATDDLLVACSPQRHVDILGFTKESIKEYASSILPSNTLRDFELYISTLESAILSLMYVPLYAVILVGVYRDSRKKSSLIFPKTQTQIYTCLCLTLLQRYIISVNPLNTTRLTLVEFSDLPEEYVPCLNKLAHLAYEQFKEEKIVFSSDVIKFVHFGFLNSEPAFYCGDEISYNFLHLTLQEFLAAYHIQQQPDCMEIFYHYCKDKRWELVWMFVSGLTKFEFFKAIDSAKCNAFTSVKKGCIEVTKLFLHCWYEGKLDFNEVFRGKSLYYYQFHSSQLERYIAGRCIAYSSPTTIWHVHLVMWDGSDDSFEWGLNSNPSRSDCGTITKLEMYHCRPTSLHSYPSRILEHIKHLTITTYDEKYSPSLLLQKIPEMKCLTELSIDLPFCLSSSRDEDNIATKLLKVSHSSITTLTLKYRSNSNLLDQNFLSSLHKLTKPSSQLKDLTIEPTCSLAVAGLNIDTNPLCEHLFRPSSLNRLTLKLPYFTEKSFDHLKTNTCLIMVHIFGKKLCLPPSIVWQSNRTIEDLRWGHCQCSYWDLQHIRRSIPPNTKLKRFDILVHGFSRAERIISREALDVDMASGDSSGTITCSSNSDSASEMV